MGADIRAVSRLGAYPASVISALTAQNHSGVRAISAVPPDMLRMMLDAVLEDFRPEAVKIGMLYDTLSVAAVADFLERSELTNIVLDPVMCATSGGNLSGGDETINLLVKRIFPLASLVTPNIPEYETLSRILRMPPERHCRALLLKGGHGSDRNCTDSLFIDGKMSDSFISPRIPSRNLHGTGCVLSSSIAAGLAKGLPLADAIREARTFLLEAIGRSAHSGLVPDNGPALL